MEIVQYEIHIEDLLIDGHPVTRFAAHLSTASEIFNLYHEKYPYHQVILYEISKNKILESEVKVKPLEAKPPLCPWKHSGKALDGRPVMRQGSVGEWHCMVCGFVSYFNP